MWLFSLLRNRIRDFIFDIGLTNGHVVENPIVYLIKYSPLGSTIVIHPNVEKWLMENCSGKYGKIKNNFVHQIAFSRKADAVLFTMIFDETKSKEYDLYWVDYETENKRLF